MTITRKTKSYLNQSNDIEESRRKKALKRFSNSYMSTSKWCRLFSNIPEELVERKCHWKLIYESQPFDTEIPDEIDLSQGYYEFFHGFFALKDVEWVEIESLNQAQLYEALNKIGKFEVSELPCRLRVYGYR
jgi:hypothetical protein